MATIYDSNEIQIFKFPQGGNPGDILMFDGEKSGKWVPFDVLDQLSYGVSWKPDVADPALTRVGNMEYHRTLPIQNNMRGCIVQPKNNKVMYYLNENDWRWREKQEGQYILTDVELSDVGTFTITHPLFTTYQYEKQWIKINNTACQIESIDIIEGTATLTLTPEQADAAEISAGTYNIELGAVLNGYDGEVMVEVPEFWIRSWDTDTKKEVRISPFKIDDSWEHQPKIYVGAYKDTVLNKVPSDWGYLSSLPINSAICVANSNTFCRGGDNNSNYDDYILIDPNRSHLGKPRTNISRNNMRTYMRNSNKEILSYLQYKRIMYWLYVIEYANFDCQLAFNNNLTSQGFKQGGLGNSITTINYTHWIYYNSNYPLNINGYTNDLGNNTNIKQLQIKTPHQKGGLADTLYTFYVPKWHGIENLFGDIHTNVDGIIIVPNSITQEGIYYNEIYVTDNPSFYNDSTISNMYRAGIEINNVEDSYIKEFDLGKTAEIIPIKSQSNSTQYKCDFHYCNLTSTEKRALILGGAAGNGALAGVGFFSSASSVGASYSYRGFRSIFSIK